MFKEHDQPINQAKNSTENDKPEELYSILEFLDGKIKNIDKKLFKLVDGSNVDKFYQVKQVNFDHTMEDFKFI